MFDCFICQNHQSDLCTTCVNTHLEEIQTEKNYVNQTLQKLKYHLETRIYTEKLELSNKVKAQRNEVARKKELIILKKKGIEEKRRRIMELKVKIEQESNQLFEKKTQLEKQYSDSVDFYCNQDAQNIRQYSNLIMKTTIQKKFNLQRLQKCFDIIPEYQNYTIGQKEFKIQKVNLLKQLNEFILIDRLNCQKQVGEFLNIPNATQTYQIDEDLYSTAIGTNINQEISIISDYFDQNDRSQHFHNLGGQRDIAFQKSRINLGRSRANTMDEFDKFEGDQGTIEADSNNDTKKQERENQKMKENPKIKEDFASFITLNQSDLDQNNKYLTLNSKQRQKALEKLEQVSGGIHVLCLMCQGISRILKVALPYKLTLKSKGFYVKDSGLNSYPLYMFAISVDQIDTKHQIQFENGIILLDKNIQYLLYINGFQLTQNSNNNQVLNINDLFSLEYLGRTFVVKEKKLPISKKKYKNNVSDNLDDLEPYERDKNVSSDNSMEFEEDKFEILKLQNRQQSANQQLESLRQSIHYDAELIQPDIKEEIAINEELAKKRRKESGNEKEWDDDDDYKDLIKKIRGLDFSRLLTDDYVS